MSRYKKMFSQLKDNHKAAFIPFVMLMDPDATTCEEIIRTLIDSGADALELGLAFSDPLADGPTIQKAANRALKNGGDYKKALEIVAKIREGNQEIPIGLLTYANLVNKNGEDYFYKTCHEHGVDSVLIADVPTIEAKSFCQSAQKNSIDPVLIAPQNMSDERIKILSELSSGYTYVVTRAGVTGARDEVKLSHKDLLTKLKTNGAPPAVFGFGISEPSHVKSAILEGARGVISGSKIVQIIEKNLADKKTMLSELAYFVKEMKSATSLAA